MQSKKVLLILVFALVVMTGMLSFRVFAAGGGGAVTFATQDVGYVFFEHNTGKLYVYNARNGELATIWKINRLGQPLEQIR